MATATKSKARSSNPGTGRFATFADVQEAVGHVPAYRIRVHPAPGEATEEDVLAIWERENRVCELIDGILVEKDVATFQSRLAGVLIFFIELFQEKTKQDLGAAIAGDGLLRLFPGQIRAPDVSFVLWKNMPNRKFPKEPIASLAPDLAVEVLSQGNTEAEMKRKLDEYFRAGSQLVWIVDPKTRTVRVHNGPRKSVLRTEDQSLDGGKVLPGFTLSIRQWFEKAEGKGER